MVSTWAPIEGKKPSPRRPARRAAASEWPPTTIGTDFATGFGLQLTLSKFTNSPAKLAPSLAHNARMAATYSSARLPRRSKGNAERLELLL
jgi:hypothetical protein